jgi:PRTRC genetic system protein E
MFTTLYPIAQGATLHLLISTEGEKLRVFVQPKPTGKDATISGPLSLLATPAELDAGFADAITTWRTPTTTLIEQAQAQAAAAQPATRPAEDSDDESGPAGSTAPATKQAARLTPKQKQAQAREAEEAKRKAARDKAAAAKAKPAGGADANTEPADRDACLADARAYLAGNAASETPVKPSRSDYLNRYAPTTGRRYERLFTSFDEFMAAAQQEALPLDPAATEPPASAPNVEAQQPGESNQSPGSETAAAASDAAAVASTPIGTCERIGGCLGTYCTPEAPAADCGRYGQPKNVEAVTLKELHTTPAGNPVTDALFTGEPALEGEDGDDDDAPLNLI